MDAAPELVNSRYRSLMTLNALTLKVVTAPAVIGLLSSRFLIDVCIFQPLLLRGFADDKIIGVNADNNAKCSFYHSFHNSTSLVGYDKKNSLTNRFCAYFKIIVKNAKYLILLNSCSI